MSERYFKIGFLALGCALIAISAWYFSNRKNKPVDADGIGWIELDSGEVTLTRLKKADRVQSKVVLRSGDTVETGDASSALLHFQDGSEFKVLEQSLITIEFSMNRTLMVLKRGDLRVDQVMTSEQIFVSKNGQRVPAEKYESLPLFREPTLPEPGDIHMGASSDREPPSEKEINDQFVRNKPAFFKCFGQLLQKKPQAKGELSISFVIVESGKVTEPNIQFPGKSAEALKDSSFEKCLVDVITRMNFGAFRGPSVSTFYPMKFD